MEMNEIFRLFGSVGVEGVDKAEKEAESLVSKWEKAGKKMGDVGKSLSLKLTAPIVAATGAIFALATKTGDYADRILDLTDITGMSAKSIQEWQHVAKIAGVETETITNAVEGLVRRLPQLEAEGGRSTEQLKKLGLSFKDLDAMHPDEMIDTLVKSLSDMEDPLERNAIGSSLFGGSWKDIAPILSVGSDNLDDLKNRAHELGTVMGDDALNKANEFRQGMVELKSSFQGAFQEIASKFMPILVDEVVPFIQNQVIPAVQNFAEKIANIIEWFKGLSPEMQKNILVTIGLLAALGPLLIIIGKVITVVTTAVKWFGLISAAVAKAGGVMAVVTGPIGWVVAAIVALIAIGVLLWKNWDTIKEKALQLYDGIKETFANIGSAIMAPIEKAKNFVHDMIEKIKSFFNFKWSLPELKMPKIAIDGKFSLLPPSAPKFSIKWNKDGFLMDQANIFGSLGNTLLGGGEAGPEALLPLNRDVLGNIGAGIADASDLNKPGLLDRLDAIIDLLLELINIDPKYQVLLDSGALVGELTPLIDQRMGRRAERKMRGG